MRLPGRKLTKPVEQFLERCCREKGASARGEADLIGFDRHVDEHAVGFDLRVDTSSPVPL
ncbi:hypothetical protein D3C81_2203450 [compost metagenome]